MKTDNLNKENNISVSGIPISITSESSLKINESYLLNNKIKMLQAQRKILSC